MSDTDRLDALAARARRDLADATAQRPLPELAWPNAGRSGARRPRVLWALRSPATLTVAAACLVLGLLLGIFVVGHRITADPHIPDSIAAGDQPSALASDGRLIWVADRGSGRVRAFDARTLAPRWTAEGGARPVALAYGLGALWVVDAGDDRLRKLSPTDGTVLGETNTSLEPVAVTTAGGRVWVLSAGNGTADAYDPQTLIQMRSAPTGTPGVDVSATADTLWAATSDRLVRIAADGSEVREFPVGATILRVAATAKYIWVATADGRLLGVDPTTGAVLGRSALAGTPTALTANADAAFVACDEGSVSRLEQPGATVAPVTRTGVSLTGLAMTSTALVGTSPSTGVLYVLKQGTP